MKPVGRAYFRAYDATNNRMGSWPANSWELTSENLKLAMLDFRRVPGFAAKESSTFQDPYFQQFMLIFMQSNCPNINEPPNWLWICGNKETELAIHNLSGHDMLTAKYVRKFSTYIPAKFEHLEDLPATHTNVRAPISLMFLIRHVDKDKINIPEEFAAPNNFVYIKPRKYQELEYRDQPSELRMEFYLQLLDLFCCPRNTIYSVFSGTKILCDGLVSHIPLVLTHVLISLLFLRHYMRRITSTRANVLACFLQMNSLDVYCLSHFEDKQYYARMVEVALTLDWKDFLPDGYLVDEEVYPRVPPKPAERKGKAPAFSLQVEETVDDEEQDDDADAEEDDDAVNLSDDKIGAPGGSEPPLIGAHLTSPDGDVDVLIRRRNVMMPRTLFDDDASVERP